MEKINDVYIWEHNLAGLSILILGVLGIIINVGLLIVLFSTGRHTVNKPNYLLINLALSNLAICFFAYPISGYAGLKHSWIWGDGVCLYYGTIALILGFSIMITMLMLIIDIYLDSHSPHYVSEKDRLRGYMILFIWLNSLFWGLAPLAGWSRIWYEPSHVSCTVDLMQPDVKYISYIILCGVWCYVLPIIAMIYCKIKLKGQTDRSSSSEILYSHKEQIIGLILLFVLEWTPYLVIYAWPIFDDPTNIPIRLDLAAPIIAKTCVVLNPLLFLVYSVEPKNDTAAKATRYSEVNVAQPE